MNIKGSVGKLTVTETSGWVFDPNSPDLHMVVSAKLDGEIIGTAIAQGFRPDLKTAGIGEGDHAFSIIFAAPINAASASRVTIEAATPDGSQHKLLLVPQLSTTPVNKPVMEGDVLHAQVKSLMKYGVLYAKSNPLGPSPGIPADLANQLDLKLSREVSHFLEKICADISEIRAAIRRDIYPIPNSNNRENYARDRDLAYWVAGYAEYKMLGGAAAKYGVVGGRYFDFGGSTGRVFRHFGIQSTAWDVWSCDFKPTSVEFVSKYLPNNFRSFLNTAYPSLPLPDNYFDLISACSVFTHIDEAETSWLLELRRILKVGGIACLTILNDVSWLNMAASLRKTVDKFRPDIANEPTLPEGKNVITFRDDDPYNCNVLHSNSYIYQNWGRYFEILEIQPAYLNNQAMVVCRRID